MLDEQKLKIRLVRIYGFTMFEKNGNPVDPSGKKVHIPSLVQMRDAVFKKISDLGFAVERVRNQNDADCIVRVFQKRHFKHDPHVLNVHGADCFVREADKWIATGEQGDFEWNASECIVEQWLYQDDCVYLDCEFFDFYLKIS